MKTRLERLIKLAYKQWKSGYSDKRNAHIAEEEIVCFLEGRLSKKEYEGVIEHLISCDSCSEIISFQAKIASGGTENPSQELIEKIKHLQLTENKPSTLEILLKFKEKLLEIINTNGDILVGRELVPAPVLRSRKIKDFENAVVILKDFKSIRVEVKIEKKEAGILDLSVLVKEKQTNKAIPGLRITLFKEGLELESYLTDSGCVIFEQMQLGIYTVEVSTTEEKLAIIQLEVET